MVMNYPYDSVYSVVCMYVYVIVHGATVKAEILVRRIFSVAMWLLVYNDV